MRISATRWPKASPGARPTDSNSGTELVIRPIEPGDKAALASAIEQSSDEAVYRRFLNPHGRLTAAELRYLAENRPPRSRGLGGGRST